jgi:hemolysin activation/secretion protein
VTGDRGYASSLELHTPAFAAPLFKHPVQTHGLIFTDYGSVHDDGLGTHQTLASTGIGFRTSVPDKLSIRIDLGRTLRPLTSSVAGAQRQIGDHFVHIKANYFF